MSCVLCVIYGQVFSFRITQRPLLFCLQGKSESSGFQTNRPILRACWKIKYLAPILRHSDSVVLEWYLGISIFNKRQKWFECNWSGNHWARLFEEAYLFITLEKIFNGHSLDFTFWDGRYHFASLKRGKVGRLESHFNVRLWESENLYTRLSCWRLY